MARVYVFIRTNDEPLIRADRVRGTSLSSCEGQKGWLEGGRVCGRMSKALEWCSTFILAPTSWTYGRIGGSSIRRVVCREAGGPLVSRHSSKTCSGPCTSAKVST